MMKQLKRSLRSTAALFAAVLLLLAAALPVCASSEYTYSWVSDNAGILSDYSESRIENICSEIYSDFGYNVYVATVYSLNGKSAEAYADDLYDSLFPLNSDGIIMLVSMEYRDYWISTSGNAINTFDEDGRIDKLDSAVVERLKKDDYDGAALSFAELTMSCLYAVRNYEQEKQTDPDNAWKNSYDYDIGDYWVEGEVPQSSFIGKRIMISLIVAVIMAFIWVSVMKSGMNTAKRNDRASDYVRKGSFNLTQSSDLYLYSTVVKTPRAQNTSSGGGGGRGGHVSSSGASHGGRGGKF